VPFEHYCPVCKELGVKRWGPFGYGVQLLAGREGAWYCAEHRPANPPSFKPVKVTGMIPSRFKALCEFCKRELDTRMDGTHQWTSGWVMQRRGGGGHAISMPKRENRWAHRQCVEKASKGSLGQTSMFGS
jgi:hypothetical protein